MSNYPQYNFDEKPSSSSKIPLITLGARVVSLATLLVSWGVLQTSEVTFDNGARLTYDYYRSYSYTLFAVIAGAIYNVLHIPFAVYFLIRKKPLINHKVFRQIELYGDKIIFGIVATGAGTALGATMDLQKTVYDDDNSKYHDFLNLMYVPSAFVWAGFVTCGISSILSCLSFHKE
ncbi:CASP-like protein PIMP1 [Nicotiana tabacum]|uniref:CASP-like protein n=2 Tax=Nicotiana TaxID=4085 RepID=A0A1S4AR97_TOBAC|nr:PREDICTED: CASP-like protein 4D1 [Nicotiana sylvestris]XP_016479209.1 PREDICTED: CASP-like protein 4D1 [Nicotiana tabacum]